MSASDNKPPAALSLLREIRECFQKAQAAQGSGAEEGKCEHTSPERSTSQLENDFLKTLDKIEGRLSSGAEKTEDGAVGNTATPQKAQNGTAEAEEDRQAGNRTPTKAHSTHSAPASHHHRNKWTSLQSQANEAINAFAGEGREPIAVWSHADIKLTDEKIMANLQRQYTLYLVGFPVHSTAAATPSKDGESAGPKVGRPDGNGTPVRGGGSPGPTKRNTSPTATHRLPPPNTLVVNPRRVTPARTAAAASVAPQSKPATTSSAAPAGEKPVSMTTPSKTQPPARGGATTTPVRRGTSPAASTKAKPAEGSQGVVFRSNGAGPGRSPSPANPKTDDQNGSKRPATAGAKPLIGISAALAHFKHIAPGETPRIAGDKRTPRAGGGTGSAAPPQQKPANTGAKGTAPPPPATANSTKPAPKTGGGSAVRK
jgi:hypothetical protein